MEHSFQDREGVGLTFRTEVPGLISALITTWICVTITRCLFIFNYSRTTLWKMDCGRLQGVGSLIEVKTIENNRKAIIGTLIAGRLIEVAA